MDHITSTAEKGQRFPEEHVWQILVQLCLALCYIHTEKGIVHRDVTPSNILLDHGGRRAKLADFGLAKQKAVGGSIMRSAVGTITFCCPEIVQHSDYTDKADVWSLGCVLYSLLALRPPFDGSNPIVVASKIVEGKYPPLAGAPYSQQLLGLVPWLLERDPERRPTAAEVAARLAPRLVGQLVRLSEAEDRLQGQLAAERERRSSERALALRNQQALQRQLRATAASAAASFAGQQQQQQQQLDAGGGDGAGGGGSGTPTAEASDSGFGAGAGTGTPPRSSLPPLSVGRAGGSLAIKQGRLRQISDPLAEVLGLLQKLFFVQRLPPGGRDARRRAIDRYLTAIFRESPGALKISLLRFRFEQLELNTAMEELLAEFGFYATASQAPPQAT